MKGKVVAGLGFIPAVGLGQGQSGLTQIIKGGHRI